MRSHTHIHIHTGTHPSSTSTSNSRNSSANRSASSNQESRNSLSGSHSHSNILTSPDHLRENRRVSKVPIKFEDEDYDIPKKILLASEKSHITISKAPQIPKKTPSKTPTKETPSKTESKSPKASVSKSPRKSQSKASDVSLLCLFCWFISSSIHCFCFSSFFHLGSPSTRPVM